MKTNPLVSILIPTYNREKYLGQALDSALSQTYPNLEIIVHDDASTDGTSNLLKKYSDPRLKIIYTRKNHGMLGGWNFIVSKARGDYLKFLASDDLFEPACVAELVAAAVHNPSAAIITCQRKFIDEQGRVVKKMGFAKKSTIISGTAHAHEILTNLRENKIGEPTAVLYPTSLVKKAGGYDPRFSQFADFEYWIRLLQFGDLVYVHKPLCSFRTHAGSNTSAAILDGRFISEIFILIRKYYRNQKFVKSFSLSNDDYHFVLHQKIWDTLKNIKDLFMQHQILQSARYFFRLIKAVIMTTGTSSNHHQ